MLNQFDECLSETTTRNIAAGRINIIGANLSSDTLSCIGETLEDPTLKPLFGIFDATNVSEQWITAHFCLDTAEREEFEAALFANQPNRTPIGSGKTFIDVQECMVDELGAVSYFAPVVQPETADRAAMETFFTNFTPFMIADIKCRQGDIGHQMEDASTMTGDAARCVVDALGPIKFGEVFLDRIWVPTNEEHFEVASTFNDCGTTTDFLNLPTSLGNVENAQLSCLLDELDNAAEPSQTSVRAFTQIGTRNNAKLAISLHCSSGHKHVVSRFQGSLTAPRLTMRPRCASSTRLTSRSTHPDWLPSIPRSTKRSRTLRSALAGSRS